MENGLTIAAFRKHLREADEPLKVLRDGQSVVWADEPDHRAMFARDPEMYALLALDGAIAPWQRARVLYQLLEQPRGDGPDALVETLDRVVRHLLVVLPDAQVLTLFLALRRSRVNHSRTSGAIVRYIINHPRLETLALRRRPAVRDALEHALGKNVMRACARLIGEGNQRDAYVIRHLLRFANSPERVTAVIPWLFRSADGPLASPDQVQEGALTPTVGVPGRDELPKTATATNRGAISATLVHLYRGGTSPELLEALEQEVTTAAARLPHFDGRLGVVLDASASTRGYGEREFCCIAQSVALRLVLERCCSNLFVQNVGGQGTIPQPEGSTDLAGALLDVLETRPDVTAIVSDGYENVYAGDLGRVVSSLPGAGVQTPLFFCHSKFFEGDDLALRRPAPQMPDLSFWHQNNFENLLLSLFESAAESDRCLKEFFLRKLSWLERECES